MLSLWFKFLGLVLVVLQVFSKPVVLREEYLISPAELPDSHSSKLTLVESIDTLAPSKPSDSVVRYPSLPSFLSPHWIKPRGVIPPDYLGSVDSDIPLSPVASLHPSFSSPLSVLSYALSVTAFAYLGYRVQRWRKHRSRRHHPVELLPITATTSPPPLFKDIPLEISPDVVYPMPRRAATPDLGRQFPRATSGLRHGRSRSLSSSSTYRPFEKQHISPLRSPFQHQSVSRSTPITPYPSQDGVLVELSSISPKYVYRLEDNFSDYASKLTHLRSMHLPSSPTTPSKTVSTRHYEQAQELPPSQHPLISIDDPQSFDIAASNRPDTGSSTKVSGGTEQMLIEFSPPPLILSLPETDDKLPEPTRESALVDISDGIASGRQLEDIPPSISISQQSSDSFDPWSDVNDDWKFDELSSTPKSMAGDVTLVSFDPEAPIKGLPDYEKVDVGDCTPDLSVYEGPNDMELSRGENRSGPTVESLSVLNLEVGDSPMNAVIPNREALPVDSGISLPQDLGPQESTLTADTSLCDEYSTDIEDVSVEDAVSTIPVIASFVDEERIGTPSVDAVSMQTEGDEDLEISLPDKLTPERDSTSPITSLSHLVALDIESDSVFERQNVERLNDLHDSTYDHLSPSQPAEIEAPASIEDIVGSPSSADLTLVVEYPEYPKKTEEYYPDPDFLPLPEFKPQDKNETGTSDLPVEEASDKRPAWSVRASDAPPLGLTTSAVKLSSTPVVKAEIVSDSLEILRQSSPAAGTADSLPGSFPLDRATKHEDPHATTPTIAAVPRRRNIRSPIDVALAMQLRPGLGMGADPAWMVRFLMAMFGWVLTSTFGLNYEMYSPVR